MNCPRSRLRIRQMAADTCDTETATRGYVKTRKPLQSTARQDRRSKQVLIAPDEHVFDPFLTTILSPYLACTRRWANGVAQRLNIPATASPTLGARSSATSRVKGKGKNRLDRVASVAVQCVIQLPQAPALSALRACFLFRQGCRSCSLLRFDPLEVFASWPGNPGRSATQTCKTSRALQPCNPSQLIDGQSLSLEIGTGRRDVIVAKFGLGRELAKAGCANAAVQYMYARLTGSC
jgi:hypothetical protein